MDGGLDNVDRMGNAATVGDKNLSSLKIPVVPTEETTVGVSLAKDSTNNHFLLPSDNGMAANSLDGTAIPNEKDIFKSAMPRDSPQGCILRREAPEWLPGTSYTTFMTTNDSEEFGYYGDYKQKEYGRTHDPHAEEHCANDSMSDMRVSPVYLPCILDHSESQITSSNDASSRQFYENKTHNNSRYTSMSSSFQGTRDSRTKRGHRYQPARQSDKSQREPSCLKIVNTPATHLTDEQKAEYEIFKEEVAHQLNQRHTDKWIISQERREAFARVASEYSMYAGIPSYVDYTLGEFEEQDKSCFCPRQLPTRPACEEDTISTVARARLVAADVIAYYQSTEWDRTNGWSPRERISLLDAGALTIAQPAMSELAPKLPITTMYVLLMHHLENSQSFTQDERPSIPCFETKGDILYVITGKKACKAQSTRAPLVMHKWRGEFSMCGFKKDDHGRLVAMNVRGQQDVGKMYQAIRRKLQHTPK
jgi:hypothetical protein